ncbi:MAG TPA: glycosyltransferase family 2 protein [Algoriphagus sp.]|nr:glycosyltransferase family 2 protein [Algoriphagus sp.]
MSNTKSVSIVIPNYNGVSLLEKYLPDTCRAIENANVEYEIIIVDDCSTDASVAWIRESFPEAVLLVNSVNSGFSVTCNRGIKVAKYELVLLLNTDVSLDKDYFEKLWRYFEEEETFGVMGRIINSEGNTEDAARMLAFSGMKFKATEFYYCDDQSKMIPTAYLSGANALVRREMLVRLGGFDEIFSPFYCEDVDLSFRAWKMGWKCYYEHEATCEHEVSKTIRSTSSKSKMLSIVYRNKFVLHAIHHNGGRLLLWYCQMLFVEVFLRILVGKFWILKSLRGFFQQKQSISNSRKKLEILMKRENQSQSLQDIKSRYFDPVRSWRIKMI